MKLRSILNGVAVATIALTVAVFITVLVLGVGSWKLQYLDVSTREMSASMLLSIGLAAGLTVGCAGAWLARPGTGGIGWAVAPMACALLSAAVAARLDGIPFISAFLTILLGLGGLVSSWHAVQSIARGDAFGAENHWGGLGNGLGGWKLTPSASSAFLSSVLFCASVACATLLPASRAEPVATASGVIKPGVAASGERR